MRVEIDVWKVWECFALGIQIGDGNAHLNQTSAHGAYIFSSMLHIMEGDLLIALCCESKPTDGVAF